MGNYIIRKKDIVRYLPKYLQENYDFLNLLDSLLTENAKINVSRMTGGNTKYYLFCLGYEEGKEKQYNTFSLSVSKTGTVNMTGGTRAKVKTSENGNLEISENAQNILAIPQKSGDYSISKRFTSRTGEYTIIRGNEEITQLLEKKNYDKDGILRKTSIKNYSADDSMLGEYVEWIADANCIKESTYYYFDTDEVVSFVKDIWPKSSESYMLTKFRPDGKLEQQTELDKETYERYVTKFYEEKLKRTIEQSKTKKKSKEAQ